MDDTNTEEGEKNHNNKNANNSAKMNADVRVGLTERYSSYLAKVLPIKSTKRREKTMASMMASSLTATTTATTTTTINDSKR